MRARSLHPIGGTVTWGMAPVRSRRVRPASAAVFWLYGMGAVFGRYSDSPTASRASVSSGEHLALSGTDRGRGGAEVFSSKHVVFSRARRLWEKRQGVTRL
jgi:hypothetical protein